MATIFRGPLFSQQQRKPAQPSVFWTTGLLVPALLLSGSVPFKTPTPQVTPQHQSHRLTANPDTSRGVPKTLYADANKAFANPPHFAPNAQGKQGYLHPDESAGTPKTLYPDASNAFANPPHKAPDRRWPVTDTTYDSPLTLLATAFVQPPLVTVPGYSVERLRHTTDTSRGVSPETLLAPFANAPQGQVSRQRIVVDTSQSAFIALTFVAPGTPFPSAAWPNATEYRGQYTPKWDWPLYQELIPPAAIVVVPEEPQGGGGGKRKKKRREVVNDDGQLVYASQAAEDAREAIAARRYPESALKAQPALEDKKPDDDEDLAFILSL